MNEIAPNIYFETRYRMVTVGAIKTPNGWVCIDTPPFPDDTHHWLTTLHEAAPIPVLYVINTDSHRDRILCNSLFGAPVVAHEAATRHMLGLNDSFISAAAQSLYDGDPTVFQVANLKPAAPGIAFDTNLTLHSGSMAVELLGHPSASSGSCWVLNRKNKIIFAGDSVVDNTHPHIGNGDIEAWLKALQELRSRTYKSWTIVSGRGDIITSTATQPLTDYLEKAHSLVNDLLANEGARSEIGQLVPELLDMFPFSETQLDETQKQIRGGLECIYDYLKTRMLANSTDTLESR